MISVVPKISSTGAFNLESSQILAAQPAQPPNDKLLKEGEAFQDFAAGTFYHTMIKALRSTERETKYFNGGRAEKIFQAEFDQRVAASMAEEHGDQLAGPLFEQHLEVSRRRVNAAAQQQNGGSTLENLDNLRPIR